MDEQGTLELQECGSMQEVCVSPSYQCRTSSAISNAQAVAGSAASADADDAAV
jgi:hypothetical protein